MTDADTAPPPRSKYLKWIVIGVIGVVALAVGGILLYVFVLNDAPDELDAGDLNDALVTDASTTPAPDTTVGSVTESTTSSTASTTSSFDGEWVPTDASEFGYRVEEVLAGLNTTAVGRSNEISGELTIEGTTATGVDIEVQIDSITSDSSLRDGQFRGRIMNADEFPTAAFDLTEPIEFGTIPTDGEQVTATATGELTLRGVTNPVTFEVTAQSTDGRIGVLGSIPVVFADYDIDNPSFGQVKTEDTGLVEFVLVFDRAA